MTSSLSNKHEDDLVNIIRGSNSVATLRAFMLQNGVNGAYRFSGLPTKPTALQLAALRGNLAIIRGLMDLGADATALDGMGNGLARYAASGGVDMSEFTPSPPKPKAALKMPKVSRPAPAQIYKFNA